MNKLLIWTLGSVVFLVAIGLLFGRLGTETGANIRSLSPGEEIVDIETYPEVMEEARGSPAIHRQRGFEGLDLQYLAARARHDAEAADDLTRFLSMCNFALGNEYTGKVSSRFGSESWRPWVEKCDWRLQQELIDSAASFAGDDSPEVNRLLAIEGDKKEEIGLRDRLALEIISYDRNPKHVMSAAAVYFDSDRIKQWSDETDSRPQAMALPAGIVNFQMDLVLMIGCRTGLDCSGFSLVALSECAATAGCMPGTPVERIVGMRRAPQEVRLMEQFVQRALEGRLN